MKEIPRLIRPIEPPISRNLDLPELGARYGELQQEAVLFKELEELRVAIASKLFDACNKNEPIKLSGLAKEYYSKDTLMPQTCMSEDDNFVYIELPFGDYTVEGCITGRHKFTDTIFMVSPVDKSILPACVRGYCLALDENLKFVERDPN